MMTVLNRFEAVFTVLAVFFFSFVLAAPLGGGLTESDPINPPPEPDGSSSILLLIQYTILLITLLLVGLRWKRALLVAIQVPLCWALPLLAVLSTQWSVVPDLTLRRGILLLEATLLGVYWATRYPLKTQLRLIGLGLGLTALLCFLFALAVPSLGIEQGDHAGAWRGLFSQKNILARVMVLGVITYLCLGLNHKRYQLWKWFGLLITSALLILSTSKSGLLILFTLLACMPIYRSLRNHTPRMFLWLLLGLLSTSCLAMVLIENAELILTSLGRDVTLTGRTGIWDVVFAKIAAHPWFGYGYKSFWLGMEGESADVWYATYFMAPHAHNGYLDLVLDLGLVGLSLFIISCTFTIRRAIALVRQHPHSMVGVYPLLYLTYLLLYNITESSLILEPNNLFWLLYVYVAASVQTQAVNLEIPIDLTIHSRLKEAHHA